MMRAWRRRTQKKNKLGILIAPCKCNEWRHKVHWSLRRVYLTVSLLGVFICSTRAAVEVCVNCGASCCAALTWLSCNWVFQICKVKCIMFKDEMQFTLMQCFPVETSSLYQLSCSSFDNPYDPSFIIQLVNRSANSCSLFQLLRPPSWWGRK